MIVNPLEQGVLVKHGQASRFSLGTTFWVWFALIVIGVGVCEASILHETNFENDKKAPVYRPQGEDS